MDRRLFLTEAFGVVGAVALTACSNGRILIPGIEAKATPTPTQEVDLMLERWGKIASNPLWYMTIYPELDKWKKSNNRGGNSGLANRIDEFFEFGLRDKTLKVADAGPNYDQTRDVSKLNTLVIHHSDGPDNVNSRRFSAWGLQNIYAKDYFENQKKYDGTKEDADRDFFGQDITGQPIWSNHFMGKPESQSDGQPLKQTEMTFASYHWKVNTDGQVERLLEDEHLGFHAPGANTAGIAVVLNGTFTERRPTPAMMDAVTDIWKTHYRDRIDPSKVVGHREVPSNNTSCPGNVFLGDTGWKSELVKRFR